MNTMNNAQVIKAIEKYTLHKYLEKLTHAPMHKLTLFKVFAHTGAPNLSDPAYLILVDDLQKIVDLNSGQYSN